MMELQNAVFGLLGPHDPARLTFTTAHNGSMIVTCIEDWRRADYYHPLSVFFSTPAAGRPMIREA